MRILPCARSAARRIIAGASCKMGNAPMRRITAAPGSGSRSRIRRETERLSAATAAPSMAILKRFAISAAIRLRRSSPLPRANSSRRWTRVCSIPSSVRISGIAPDSTMDGYPVMDIATFLGANSGYYLSRFHFMRLQKSKMSWNCRRLFSRFFGRCIEKCIGCSGFCLEYPSCFFFPLPV